MIKYTQCLSAILLWTYFMILMAQLLENNLFQGSIVAWMIGIPFIVAIVLTAKDSRIQNLLMNVNKFSSGEDMMGQIRYLLKLI